jgi:hypothetical protein
MRLRRDSGGLGVSAVTAFCPTWPPCSVAMRAGPGGSATAAFTRVYSSIAGAVQDPRPPITKQQVPPDETASTWVRALRAESGNDD